MDRKTKLQKPRSKTSDGRKQLSNVRVIQRNLAYIVGLPLNLADEDVRSVLPLVLVSLHLSSFLIIEARRPVH